MTITSYFGTKPCCDCGRTGNYTVNKNGYQFTVCADCVQNYSEPDKAEYDRNEFIADMDLIGMMTKTDKEETEEKNENN